MHLKQAAGETDVPMPDTDAARGSTSEGVAQSEASPRGPRFIATGAPLLPVAGMLMTDASRTLVAPPGGAAPSLILEDPLNEPRRIFIGSVDVAMRAGAPRVLTLAQLAALHPHLDADDVQQLWQNLPQLGPLAGVASPIIKETSDSNVVIDELQATCLAYHRPVHNHSPYRQLSGHVSRTRGMQVYVSRHYQHDFVGPPMEVCMYEEEAY